MYKIKQTTINMQLTSVMLLDGNHIRYVCIFVVSKTNLTTVPLQENTDSIGNSVLYI